MSIKTKISFSLFGILAFISTTLAQQGAFVSVVNSTAGEDNPIRISGLFSAENINIRLSRPDGTAIDFKQKANLNGVSAFDIYGLHLRQAGLYTLNILRKTETVTKTFEMFPGTVSAYTSKISIQNKSVEADGEMEARFNVKLSDSFGNVVNNKKLTVYSSRNEDLITTQGVSDTNGEAFGKIKSHTPGIAIISVLTDGVLIFQKPEVIFYLSGENMKNVGSDISYGEYLKAQLFDDGSGQELAYFTLEDLDTEAIVDEALTVKVVARDINGDVATGYTGTVRFSSTDDRAVLPADYQFTFEDQGIHTFFLAISYKTPGTQTLASHDLDDFRKSGELELSITLGNGDALPIPTEKGITILTPHPGIFRSSRVTITGEAKDVSVIRLQDGNTVLIEALAIDSQSNFVFPTPALADGIHIFKAFDTESELVSNEVSIEIDRTAPTNLSVNVEPTGTLNPDQEFLVTVFSDEPLSGATVVFNGVLTQLIPSEDTFVATLTTPLEAGIYPLDIVAIDLLGNEGEFPNAGEINVLGSVTINENDNINNDGFSGDNNDSANNSNNNGSDSINPIAVSNVSSQSGDEKITIFWSPSNDDDGISNYQIEFAENQLSNTEPLEDELIFDKSNITPDDRTQWYIDNLSDDKQYAFRVIAIDKTGNQSPPSNIIQGLTNGAKENLKNLNNTIIKETPKVTESGTKELWWPFFIALFGGISVILFLRQRA